MNPPIPHLRRIQRARSMGTKAAHDVRLYQTTRSLDEAKIALVDTLHHTTDTVILIPPRIGSKTPYRARIGECTDVCGYSQPGPGVLPGRRTCRMQDATRGLLVNLGYSWLGGGQGGRLGAAWTCLARVSVAGRA
jgi:hypothetical protein